MIVHVEYIKKTSREELGLNKILTDHRPLVKKKQTQCSQFYDLVCIFSLPCAY